MVLGMENLDTKCMTFDLWKEFYRKEGQLYLTQPSLRLYQVVSREAGRLEGYDVPHLVKATFSQGDCGCGSDNDIKGNLLITLSRFKISSDFALSGDARAYDISTNTLSGVEHPIYLYFSKIPSVLSRVYLVN